MNIYVASSWRNEHQPIIVDTLRDAGHVPYDFRNPDHGRGGFSWSEISPDWQSWTPLQYRDELLNSPVAAQGYLSDLRAMMAADAFLLVMPCGRSAHLELGWACGAGKKTAILLSDGEPELMALMVDDLFCSVEEIIDAWDGL